MLIREKASPSPRIGNSQNQDPKCPDLWERNFCHERCFKPRGYNSPRGSMSPRCTHAVEQIGNVFEMMDGLMIKVDEAMSPILKNLDEFFAY